MSRSFGGRSLTTSSPIRTSPRVMSSSPATIRSAVVLPQPDGPTKTTSSPSADLRSSVRDRLRAVGVDLRHVLEGDLGHAVTRPSGSPFAGVQTVGSRRPWQAVRSRARSRRRRRSSRETAGCSLALICARRSSSSSLLVGGPLLLSVYLSITDATAGSLTRRLRRLRQLRRPVARPELPHRAPEHDRLHARRERDRRRSRAPCSPTC